MFSTYSVKMLRFFAWGLHKAFKAMYEKIVIDEEKIK